MICIDASVVAKLVSADEAVEAINRQYEEARIAGEKFIAPTLLPYEIASVLRKKVLKGLLAPSEIVGAVRQFRGLHIQLEDFEGLIERSLSLSESFAPRLTVYDASYMAVSERHRAPLWTADQEFYRLVSFSFPEITLVAH